MDTGCLGNIIYIITVKGTRQDLLLRHLCIGISPTSEALNFLCERKDLLSLIFLIESYN
jgi:hypothetical protein